LLALRAAELQPGKTVLAPAIGGSMGNAMTQLARALDARHAVSATTIHAKSAEALRYLVEAVRSDGYFSRYSSHVDRVHDW